MANNETMNPDLLLKYLDNEASDQEMREVLAWLEADPANRLELDRLDRLEAEGRAYVFYANDQGVKNTERDAEKLARNYERGRMQALSEFDRWERFLSGQGV